jgi:hypothetical protein
MDEVIDIQAITSDQKRKSIMKRNTQKWRLTLESSILITTEDKLISTEHAKRFEIIAVGMEITDATLYRARKDEEELSTMLKELQHLRHLDKYYQESTQATVFLRSELWHHYEDTIMALVTYKGMEIWYEKAHQEVERI